MLKEVEPQQQISLEMPIKRLSIHDVSDDVIRTKNTFRDALLLCVQLAPVPEKVVYMELGIDKGQWSRMKGGTAHFPDEKLPTLMDLCGNEVPLRWLALNRG